ncbi:MAG TPA: BamA/TamA family outer membrane protein [Gammaproteobacteria bacterium]
MLRLLCSSNKSSLAVTAAAAGCLGATVAAAQEELTLAELEQRGVVIGAVNLQIDNIFDTSDPAENGRMHRWANRVHRTTRPSVIEDILLFETGDNLLEQVIEETARLLRDRGFVADATVTASNFNATTNTADVNVRVRDAWSLEPDLKLSRSGGENEFGIGIAEDNLFGLGKSMTLSYETDVDRDQRLFSYRDDNLFGSRKQLGVNIADLSDGRQFRITTGRPFFSLDTRWSVTAETLDDQRVDPIYDLGEVIDEFRHDTRLVSIQGGRSRGLVDGMTRRWLAGLTFEEDEFQNSSRFGPAVLLPENRRLIYPWAGIQLIGDDFRQVSELNDMGRTEDIALGLNLFARLGVASPSLDSDRRAVLLDVSAERGWEPRGPGSLLLFSASAASRVEKDDFRNTIVSLSARYMQRNLGDELFLVSFRTVFANRLDAENQLLIGGDNDLRGYPLRYQSGERSAILNVEQRFFTDWYPFRLFRVGYAFFFDAGRVWNDDPRNTPNLGTLYDVGVGLRLTSPRSSSRSVVHIELAFPIDAPADIDDVQLVLERKASF